MIRRNNKSTRNVLQSTMVTINSDLGDLYEDHEQSPVTQYPSTEMVTPTVKHFTSNKRQSNFSLVESSLLSPPPIQEEDW
jgi:hypothetical protein